MTYILLSNAVSFAWTMKTASSWPITKLEVSLLKSSATFFLPAKQLYHVKSASRRHLIVKKRVVRTNWDLSTTPTSLILFRMFRQKKIVRRSASQPKIANTTLTFWRKTLRTLKTVSFSLLCLIHKRSVRVACQALFFAKSPQHQSTHLPSLLLLQAQHPPPWPLL